MKRRFALLLLGGFLLLVISGLVYHYSRPGRALQRFMPGCLGCHVRVTLEWDGIAASRFSKGTHPVNVSKIRPLKNLASEDWKFFRPADLTGQSCAFCHTEQHQSWQASAHGRAFRNEIFQHAYFRDRDAWCLNCHAPLWEPDQMDPVQIAEKPDMQAVYASGVTCAVCHLRDGQITSATDYTGKENQLFHPVRYDPQFGSENFCAGCHQFNFTEKIHPVVVYEDDENPMQDVVREFQAGNGHLFPEACTGCHFYQGDHSLKSEAQPDLRKKLHLHISQTQSHANYELAIRVEMPRLGHHFPTGDLFRILSFYAYGARGNELTRYDFRKEVRVVDRKVMQDTTLKPHPEQEGARARLSFTLPEEAKRCKLVYRLQGSIDSEIEKDFTDRSVLYDVLYDGPCS